MTGLRVSVVEASKLETRGGVPRWRCFAALYLTRRAFSRLYFQENPKEKTRTAISQSRGKFLAIEIGSTANTSPSLRPTRNAAAMIATTSKRKAATKSKTKPARILLRKFTVRLNHPAANREQILETLRRFYSNPYPLSRTSCLALVWRARSNVTRVSRADAAKAAR